MEKSIGENSASEVDLVDCRHVILEVHHVVKSQLLSLVYRIVAANRQLCWYLAQINTLDMVPHV